MKKQNKLLTIIVPYKDSATLNASLTSLFLQAYKEIEVLVVNGEELSFDARVRKITTEKKDLFHVALEGMKQAKGDYISFLLPGHTVSVDLYRNMIFRAEKTDSDMIMSQFVEEQKGEFYLYNMMQIFFEELNGKEIFSAFMQQEGLNTLWNLLDNKIYRKDLVKKVLKRGKEISFACQNLMLLNYFFYKEALRLNGITNDVLYIKEEETLFDKDSIISTFVFIEKDLQRENSYKTHFFAWKCLYAEKLRKQRCSIDDFCPNYKPVLNKDYFTIVKTKWNEGLELIKKGIMDDSIQLVSFDIFDTLVVRSFFEPTDLFDVVDKYFRNLTQNKTATEFKKIRVDSELLARKLKKKEVSSSQEITLDAIYQTMQKRYHLDDELTKKLKDFELEQELRFCKQRETAYELYALALYLEKRVICTSDMYLGESFLDKLIKNCGYDHVSKIYVSSTYDKTKALGDLYKIVSTEEKVDFKQILHIGDNYISDIQNAKNYGIKAFQLYKPIEVFLDKNKTGCLSAILSEHLPFWMDNANGLLFNGVRVMSAIVANKYFDNPFKTFNDRSDFNADPFLIGYYALGSYMFGLTKWMLDDMQGKGYEKVVFMARDGYLPMECYKLMKTYYQEQPKEQYFYVSRKALIPTIVQNKMDFYKLTEAFNVEKVTPLDFASYIHHLIDYDEVKFKSICEANKLNPKVHLKTIEEYNALVDLVIENFYNQEKHEHNMEILSSYFKEIFGNRSATFDVGYSARPSYFISNLLGTPVDTYFCNITSNQALRHAAMGNFKLNIFFDGRPCATGHAYELLLSKMAPSCIAYDIVNDKVVPKFEEYSIHPISEFTVRTMQEAAISFVKEISSTFKADMDLLYFQNYYISIPFMAYMNSSKEIDKYPLHSVIFEDDLGIGEPTKMVRVWQDELMARNQHTIPALLNVSDEGLDNFFTGNHLVYNSNINLQNENKIKRLLFYVLFDRETLKRRISEIKHHYWNRKK